jgi:hypothetical protein
MTRRPDKQHPPDRQPGGEQPVVNGRPRAGCHSSHQLTLDDEYSRVSDPPTSREAAAKLEPTRVRKQVTDVVTAVASHKDGAICAQVTEDLDRDRGCIARRLTDAHRLGYVRPAGYRTAPSGRRQIVWAVTASGQSLAARQIADSGVS